MKRRRAAPPRRRGAPQARGEARARRSHGRDLPPAVGYMPLLACLKRADGPVSIPEILRRLGLDVSLEPALRAQMELLEREGVVFSQRRGRWTMHARARVVIGRLSSPKRTYGFVIPEDGVGSDLYVPGRRMGGAAHGDLVMARVIGSRLRQERRSESFEAEIIAVLERRAPYLAGLFHGDAAGGVVVPRDERISAEIVIEKPPPEAADRAAADEGLVVWAEITSPEDRHRPARGRIVSVLGRAGEPGVDAAVIERTYELPGEFPAHAAATAAALGSVVGPDQLAGREDFSASTVVTVDPATARDHDDAVGLERLGTPHGAIYRLAVHIADVSHYVREADPIDAEALRRGTSVYFPGYSIPMLPEALSSGLCSLLPGRLRLVQSVVMDFDGQGRKVHHRFADGFIRSAARLTYDQVTEALEGRASPPGADAAMLADMASLCRLLRARRMRRGSLDLNLPETEVIVDDAGRPVDLRVVRQDISHQIIEEFMLAANETVAEHLSAATHASLYRIHEDPDPSGIDEVEQDLLGMGFSIPRTRGGASARIRSLLATFAGRPEEPAVAMMILRSLKLARYSHEAVGHFGLAAPLYTHFTSPIRRYPDLVVHRLLRETRRPGWRRGQDGAGPAERLAAVALESSRLERRAAEAERAMVEWKKAVYMSGRVGREYPGMVTGVTANAVFVTLEDIGVEGIVPSDAGGGQGAPRRRAASRRYRLGDPVRVRVQSVDTFRARVLLKALSTG